VNAYTSAFTGAFKRTLRERASIIHTTSFYAVLLVAWGSIWWAATRGGTTAIQGYEFADIFWYLAATEAAVIVVNSRKIELIGEEIAAGAIESEMLRPVSVLGLRISLQAGESVAKLCAVVPTGLLLSVLYTHTVPNGAALLVALPTVLLAVVANLIALHAFAALSFWVRDSRAAWFLYQKLIFMIGGMLLPLQLLPSALEAAAWTLPFWTMAYAPGRLASGTFEPWLLAGQLTWIGVLFAAAAGLFAMGQRRIQQGVV
jgi:ABC-2 type transport system permease protein